MHLLGGIRPNGILIPRTAVNQGAQGFFVWIAGKDGKAEFRAVEVGDWQGNDVFINSGLAAGDRIILDNLLKMSPGAPSRSIRPRLPKAPHLSRIRNRRRRR